MQKAGINFEVIPAKGEEKIESDIPAEVVKKLSFKKAAEIFELETKINLNKEALQKISVNSNFDTNSCDNFGDYSKGEIQSPVVIGADTVVSYNQKVLGKPKDKEMARKMISGIQGQSHEVYTGVSILWKQDGKILSLVFAEETQVFVYPMTGEEIESYISTDEPYDKAGAYGIQGVFGMYVKGIHGDYNNVVGLPIARLYQVLKHCNIL